MPAPRPLHESARLDALRRYEQLDTDPEVAFDDLTALAATLCEVPVALTSLVDADRQWFKARVGVDVRETPRDLAFCAHAILDVGTMVVEDAQADPRFADNPLVTSAPHIRFYAGAPLVTSDGHALGTLCVMDRRPRRLSADKLRGLEILAREVMARMELERVARDLAQALEGVRTLEGLLPICSWCKNVRDDDGYWRRVEEYLTAHADVELTHGMCPRCFEKQLGTGGS